MPQTRTKSACEKSKNVQYMNYCTSGNSAFLACLKLVLRWRLDLASAVLIFLRLSFSTAPAEAELSATITSHLERFAGTCRGKN